jgi:hypothetical protein
MTLLLTVVKDGKTVSGARVSAQIDGVECGTVVTTGPAQLLRFPKPNPPESCRQTGAQIRFVVDDVEIPVRGVYLVGSTQAYDLVIP